MRGGGWKGGRCCGTFASTSCCRWHTILLCFRAVAALLALLLLVLVLLLLLCLPQQWGPIAMLSLRPYLGGRGHQLRIGVAHCAA
jgi:hypothetical protein